jgi:hypothetical protein
LAAIHPLSVASIARPAKARSIPKYGRNGKSAPSIDSRSRFAIELLAILKQESKFSPCLDMVLSKLFAIQGTKDFGSSSANLRLQWDYFSSSLFIRAYVIERRDTPAERIRTSPVEVHER